MSELEEWIRAELRKGYRTELDRGIEEWLGDLDGVRFTGVRPNGEPEAAPTLDGLLAECRRLIEPFRGGPVCVAANTATIARLSALATVDDPDAPPWREEYAARIYGLPVFVDDDLADGVVEPRTEYPTRTDTPEGTHP